ncbi:MAG: GPR endopeptidase [Clostridia bacterium]|nr:GPR endopeptidase [Clostridia bacterium]
MNCRTDLAIEAAAQAEKLGEKDVRQATSTVDGVHVSRLQILSPQGAAALGKPIGQYVTAQLPPLSDDEKRLTAYAAAIAQELSALLPPHGTVLVVGLGNRSVTPDTLGPAAADMVLATRHIRGEFARAAGLDDLRPTAVLSPGVLGQTGTESSEIVRGVCREVDPCAVVVIDALAARSVERLGCTVQLCDTGIAPGSGVGNDRKPLNREVLGVPVIGMGVPTVVDAVTLVRAYLHEDTDAPREEPPMMVTPREIDLVISRAARLVAMAINGALQPAYSPLELISVARGM